MFSTTGNSVKGQMLQEGKSGFELIIFYKLPNVEHNLYIYMFIIRILCLSFLIVEFQLLFLQQKTL